MAVNRSPVIPIPIFCEEVSRLIIKPYMQTAARIPNHPYAVQANLVTGIPTSSNNNKAYSSFRNLHLYTI